MEPDIAVMSRDDQNRGATRPAGAGATLRPSAADPRRRQAPTEAREAVRSGVYRRSGLECPN